MGRWSVTVAALVTVLLASSCSDDAGQWGDEAVTYVEAFDQARQQSSGAFLVFYGPEVVVDDPNGLGPFAVGREEFGRALKSSFGVGDELDEGVWGDFAIDRTGLAIGWRWQSEGQSGAAPDGLISRELDEGGLVTRETIAWAVEDLADPQVQVGPVYVDRAPAAQDLVAAYVEAWSSSDPVRVGALYAADARMEDSLLRIELDGAAAIRSFVAGNRRSEGEALRLGTTPDGGDAVYVRWRDGINDAVANRIEVTVSFADHDGSGCPGRTVAELSIADGLIIDERRFRDVDDLRRCLDTDELPEGWWTELQPPAPAPGEVTDVVEVDGREVEVHNGTPALEQLVAWGFARFVDAGLGAPAVELVGFGEDVYVEQCVDRRHGLALDVGATTQLYLCFDEDQACADPGCGEFRQLVRRLMLHEIGHAWLNDHVSVATQQAFVELMGLEQWRAESIPREQRGVEQAANVLAWGVMQFQMDAMRGRACDELSAAFELLTGDQPQQPCAGAASR